MRFSLNTILFALQPYRQFARYSFSEHGEDLVVSDLADQIGIKLGRYLDLGGSHPIAASNTYHFYRQGWTGVCVEPNPEFVPLYKKFRPRDKLIQAAVTGNGNDPLQFSILSTYGNSTTNANRVLDLLQEGHSVVKTISVPSLPINDIIESVGSVPDFVSMDIETMDYEVLSAWDFQRWRPSIFCIETGHQPQFDTLMKHAGYSRVATLSANTIYKRAE